MPGPQETLNERLGEAFARIEPGSEPVLRPSTRPGVDFQANGAMALAKKQGRPPGEIAAAVVSAARLDGICAKVESTPQGFVNLVLDDAFLASCLQEQARDPRRGVSLSSESRTVVVDYSSPNVAKEMHAGHLRTSIIGDALCRMLTLTGARVIKENHVGDWGTPFGMLIEHLIDLGEEEGARELSVGDLDTFYRQARAAFDASLEFQERSRRRVVLLQSGDPETLRLWRILVDESVSYFEEVYARLGLLLTRQDLAGESVYNDQLRSIVDELAAKGLLRESEGALCVFPEGFTNREGEPLPLIVQKSDGGYGYAATDLATLRDRFGRLGADLALYVVGSPQAQHLEMCFAVARAAGWIPPGGDAVHVAFGSVLGSDRRMLRSRSGDSVKLIELLDEAVKRAAVAVEEKNPSLGEEERAEVARMVGIGAVKYSDLSTDRIRDYVFDWDRMLAFDGNTGPYLQYARVRCLSIFRRGGIDAGVYQAGEVSFLLAEPAERELALVLTAYAHAVVATLETWSPHKLCSYLFDLAGAFTTFFETCPVLKAGDPAVRDSRLGLCALTASVLEAGLSVLGIEVPDRM
ncbi:MAG TPA: arginine--tRNA ligase [Acidimicrobiales bacterium]|nr:arginine--tRNA ligase [Acidimicrobiales bacterium]